MIWLLNVALLMLLVATAIAVVVNNDLLAAAITFSIYSFIMAMLYTQLNAPDVGLTEAAVGAGATTVLFIIAISKTSRREED